MQMSMGSPYLCLLSKCQLLALLDFSSLPPCSCGAALTAGGRRCHVSRSGYGQGKLFLCQCLVTRRTTLHVLRDSSEGKPRAGRELSAAVSVNRRVMVLKVGLRCFDLGFYFNSKSYCSLKLLRILRVGIAHNTVSQLSGSTAESFIFL